MTTEQGTPAGGATFYAQARQMKEGGVRKQQAIQNLIQAGMDAGRARELADAVFGAPAKPTPAAMKAVEDGSRSLARSAGAGLAAAIICGFFWGLLAYATHYAFGIVAWGAGAAVGFAVYAATPLEHQDSPHIPLIASICAMVAILAGEYFTACFLGSNSLLGAFSLNSAGIFVDNMARFCRPMDIVWFFLAVVSAIKIASQGQ